MVCDRERRRAKGRILVAGLVLALLAGRGDAAEPERKPLTIVEAEIGGMIAVVPAAGEDAVRIVAVNSTAPHGGHGLVHRPRLGVRNCADLKESAARTACRDKASGSGWEADPNGDFDQRGALYDLSAGYDVRLLDASGTVVAGGLERSPVLSDYLVEMEAFGLEESTVSPLVAAASASGLSKLAVFRAGLRAGELTVSRLEPRRDWSFIDRRGKEKLHRDKVAATLSWRVEIPGDEFILELCPYGSGCMAGKTTRFLFEPGSGHTVRIGFFNEPTREEFCKQEPNPFDPVLRHFEGYYGLTANPRSVDVHLPRYHGSETYCGEPHIMGRPPIICMSPIFREASQVW